MNGIYQTVVKKKKPCKYDPLMIIKNSCLPSLWEITKYDARGHQLKPLIKFFISSGVSNCPFIRSITPSSIAI